MIEKILEIIAPDTCLVCFKEGLGICQDCADIHLVTKKPSCVVCNKLNTDGKTCKNCFLKSKLSGAGISYRYEGIVRDLVWGLKYENKRSYARLLAIMLPFRAADIVCYVPSDGKTRRSRGYDQAELLARNYAKNNKLFFSKVLLRQSHIRQVGLNRAERIQNTKDNFICIADVKDKRILLIDDVVTTAATVSECARTLSSAGAKEVWVVAVAKG